MILSPAPPIPPILLDRTHIRTRVRLHPQLLQNPSDFILANNLPIRTTRQGTGRHGTRNLTLDVLTYKGIKMECAIVEGDTHADVTIQFNPGVCLFAHNGRIIHLADFLHALNLLATQLTPLLDDIDDWVDLVPGLHSGSPAYWSYLEIPLHCGDANHELLCGFRHLRHPAIRKPTRHWHDSIIAGAERGKLGIAIYRKAREMVNHEKLQNPRTAELDFTDDILRLEVRLRGDKLVNYLGNERNVGVVNGEKRVVRFFPEDLMRAHRNVFSELKGVYAPQNGSPVETGKCKPLEALGITLARVAADPNFRIPLPHLLSKIAYYTGAKPGSNTIASIRKAAEAEISGMSTMSIDTLFGDANYRNPPFVPSAAQEHLISHAVDDLLPHPLIRAAYQPPGANLDPGFTVRSYFR